MAETLDNDLLTLWVNAGSLDRDAVRALIDELQQARDAEVSTDALLRETRKRLYAYEAPAENASWEATP